MLFSLCVGRRPTSVVDDRSAAFTRFIAAYFKAVCFSLSHEGPCERRLLLSAVDFTINERLNKERASFMRRRYEGHFEVKFSERVLIELSL